MVTTAYSIAGCRSGIVSIASADLEVLSFPCWLAVLHWIAWSYISVYFCRFFMTSSSGQCVSKLRFDELDLYCRQDKSLRVSIPLEVMAN